MGLLEGTPLQLPGFFDRTPVAIGQDFPEGFSIQETQDASQKVVLTGTMMPLVPFETGGEQKVQKDYYAGNPEPVIHVMGSREDDVTVRGRIYEKKNPRAPARGDANKVCEALDVLRIRGNLLQITLGAWSRYCYLINTHFKMTNLGDIEYELKFAIVSDQNPKNNYFTGDEAAVPFAINNELKARLAHWNSRPIPSVPQSIGDLLNQGVSKVASAISTVTNLVDGMVGTAEDITRTLNRAVGVLKNAQVTVNQTQRRIGALSYTWSQYQARNVWLTGANSGRPGQDLLAPTKPALQIYQLNATKYIAQAQSDLTAMRGFLLQMLAQFAALSKTAPLFRYRVVSGDTLQKLSVRFYGTSDHWKAIYDHNKLSSTVLGVGAVLEIPKL